MDIISKYFLKAMFSAIAGVGLLEWLKDLIKTEKTRIYSLLMPFVAVGCFCAIEYLPIGVFGSIVTIGIMQIDYQVIIQGFKKIGKAKIKSIAVSEDANEQSD